MLRMSKAPLNAAQVRSYHEREFVNSEQRYYSQDNAVRGEWQGNLAAEWGLRGSVRDVQFYRLAEGQHPVTGEQLVRHRIASEYQNQQGETVQSAEHRAGWDATFNAPKSVSITALVGGDEPRGMAAVFLGFDQAGDFAQVHIDDDFHVGRAPAAVLHPDIAREGAFLDAAMDPGFLGGLQGGGLGMAQACFGAALGKCPAIATSADQEKFDPALPQTIADGGYLLGPA